MRNYRVAKNNYCMNSTGHRYQNATFQLSSAEFNLAELVLGTPFEMVKGEWLFCYFVGEGFFN